MIATLLRENLALRQELEVTLAKLEWFTGPQTRRTSIDVFAQDWATR